ncbi:MAG: asparaginase [Desulfobacterales bacterium]|nr:asparaginase [Desulfobacterales bacterium]MCP4159205.1 asparaginase [Deltaproteobacteria bacterium]
MDLKIFTVGGTIDKIYFDGKSKYEVGQPTIVKLLKEAGATVDYEIESLLYKDSLEMNDSDRALIHENVMKQTCDKILITHGTDTMIDTAKKLKDIEGKTIVITGSMSPSIFRESDASFNIGSAVTASQILSPGVYIAMNGKIFDPLTSRKNVEKNRFEDL